MILRIIEEYSFSYSDISRIKFPSQLTQISDFSFINCSELEFVEFVCLYSKNVFFTNNFLEKFDVLRS